MTYGCTTDIMTSDHSPVFAGFEMHISNQFVSAYTGQENLCQIEIQEATVTIYDASKTNLYCEVMLWCIRFCSYCVHVSRKQSCLY